jgi:hypothetical protein
MRKRGSNGSQGRSVGARRGLSTLGRHRSGRNPANANKQRLFEMRADA